MPCLNHCCCCCSLRSGGVTLGWIDAVFGLISITISSIMIADPGLFVYNDDPQIKNIIKYSGAGQLVSAIINFISSCLLIAGAVKRSHLLLLPWLILKMIGIILYITGSIVFIALTIESGLFILGIILLLFTALWLYFWVCVLSLYQELRKHEKDDLERMKRMMGQGEQNAGTNSHAVYPIRHFQISPASGPIQYIDN